jgi:hypothetical protein
MPCRCPTSFRCGADAAGAAKKTLRPSVKGVSKGPRKRGGDGDRVEVAVEVEVEVEVGVGVGVAVAVAVEVAVVVVVVVRGSGSVRHESAQSAVIRKNLRIAHILASARRARSVHRRSP